VGGGLPAFQIYICSKKKYKGLIKGVYIHNSNCKWGSVHNTDSRKPRVYNTFAERMRRRAVKWRLVVKFSMRSEVSKRFGLKSMVSSLPRFNQMLEH
jgi:hypothetical protein